MSNPGNAVETPQDGIGYCTHCSTPNPRTSLFCSHCGKELPWVNEIADRYKRHPSISSAAKTPASEGVTPLRIPHSTWGAPAVSLKVSESSSRPRNKKREILLWVFITLGGIIGWWDAVQQNEAIEAQDALSHVPQNSIADQMDSDTSVAYDPVQQSSP